MAKRPRSSKDIEGQYKKAKIIASPSAPLLLRLQLMGKTARGGYLSRQLRLNRKISKQIKGLGSSGPILKD